METKPGSKRAAALLSAALIAGTAIAADTPYGPSVTREPRTSGDPSPQASIPFANRGGISGWKVVDDSTLLIQDNHGHWYLAKLLTASYDLRYAESLGFVTPPSGEFGKLSSVVVRGQRYPVVSLTRTDPPAKP